MEYSKNIEQPEEIFSPTEEISSIHIEGTLTKEKYNESSFLNEVQEQIFNLDKQGSSELDDIELGSGCTDTEIREINLSLGIDDRLEYIANKARALLLKMSRRMTSPYVKAYHMISKLPNDIENISDRIKYRDGYDASDEISKLRQVPYSTRNEKVYEIKRELAEQSKLVARAEVSLRMAIGENPDASRTELLDSFIKHIGPKYLNAEHVIAAKSVIREFFRRRKSISKILENDPSLDVITKRCFGFIPKGEVEVVVCPIMLYFKFEDPEDFEVAYYTGNSNKNNYKKNLNTVAGFYHPNSKWGGIACGENSSVIKDPEHSELIITHEEEHAFHDLLVKTRMESSYSLLVINSSNIKEVEKSTRQYFKDVRAEHIDSKIADEILAYYSDGSFPDNIQEVIESDYLPDYCASVDNSRLNATSAYKRKFGSKSSFSPDYIFVEEIKEGSSKVLREGISAIKILEEHGYSSEMISALLGDKQLKSWKKYARRATEVQEQIK